MSGPCAIPGCEVAAKPGQLMCLAHWRRVPRALNHAVFDTFRAWDAARGPDRAEKREAYRSARDAAIEAVVEKEKAK